MIDEEKVLRMTKMASYEAGGGKKDKAVAGFFKGDYIGMQMLISFLFVTVAFAAGIGAYVCFYFEEVMAQIYAMDLLAVGKKVLFYYVLVLVPYLAVTQVVYRIRYTKARKRLNLFWDYLDCLEQTGDDTENGKE